MRSGKGVCRVVLGELWRKEMQLVLELVSYCFVKGRGRASRAAASLEWFSNDIYRRFGIRTEPA